MVRPGRWGLVPLIGVIGWVTACSAAGSDPTWPLLRDQDPPVIRLGEPFVIAPGGTVIVDETGWTLGLDAVIADSRCPVDVTCVWAGEVVARLVLRRAGEDPVEVKLSTQDRRGVDVADLNLKIEAVAPPRVSGQTIDQAAYRLTLVITRADEAVAPPT